MNRNSDADDDAVVFVAPRFVGQVFDPTEAPQRRPRFEPAPEDDEPPTLPEAPAPAGSASPVSASPVSASPVSASPASASPSRPWLPVALHAVGVVVGAVGGVVVGPAIALAVMLLPATEGTAEEAAVAPTVFPARTDLMITVDEASAVTVACGAGSARGHTTVHLTEVPPGPCTIAARWQGAVYATALEKPEPRFYRCRVEEDELICR